jgi:hypothetical protein
MENNLHSPMPKLGLEITFLIGYNKLACDSQAWHKPCFKLATRIQAIAADNAKKSLGWKK